MAAPYVDPDDLKVSLGINDTYADDDVEAACIAASECLNDELGRHFSKADATRLYTALDPDLLNIRDLVSLTTLKTDEDGDGVFETTWTSSDYLLYPLNAAADSEPYTKILVNLSAGSHQFPLDIQGGVQIVGTWGWPKIPQKIVMAAAIIAVQLMKRRRENPSFIITAAEAIVILRNDPQINTLLKGLSRPQVIES